MTVIPDFFSLLRPPYGGLARRARALFITTKGRPTVLRLARSSVDQIPEDTRGKFLALWQRKTHGVSAGKYYNFPLHVARAVVQADALGLVGNSKKRRVLDLGTGFGYFPLVCKNLGHQATGLDRGDKPIYRSAREKLSISVIEWTISPSDPLPEFEEKFDLISAFQPVFFLYDSRGEYGTLWSLSEWREFFSQLAPYLEENGCLFIGGNSMSAQAVADYKKIEAYFERSHGKRVLDGWLLSRQSVNQLSDF